MDPLTIAALIAGVVGLGASAVGYFSNRETNATNESNVNSTNQINAALQRETNQSSISQAAKNREYYSPAHMMQMLEGAGLNRNLVAQQAVTGAGSSTPSLGTATMAPAIHHAFDPSRYGNPAGSAVDAALKVAQVNNINKDTDLKGSQIQLNETSSLNILENTKLTTAQINQVKQNCLLMSSQIDNYRALTENLDAQTKGQLIDNLWKDKRYTAEIGNLSAQTRKALGELRKIDTEIEIDKVNLEYLEKTLVSRILGVQLQNESLDAGIKLVTEQAATEILRQNGLILSNGSSALEFLLNKRTFQYLDNLEGNFIYQIVKYAGLVGDAAPHLPIRVGINQ